MWPLPRRRAYAAEVVDPEGFNEAVRDFETMRGAINEHSFDADTLKASLTHTTHFSEAIAERIAAGYTADTGLVDDAETHPDNIATAQEITTQNVWTVVQGISVEFTSDNYGFLELLANPQFGMPSDATKSCSLKFAWRVDGALFGEFTIGGHDNSSEAENAEQGMSGYVNAVDVETVVSINPGYHKVELVAWMQGIASLTTAFPLAWIYQVEYLITETYR